MRWLIIAILFLVVAGLFVWVSLKALANPYKPKPADVGIDWVVVLEEMDKYPAIWIDVNILLKYPELLECAASPDIKFIVE
jgi:hypothetical protein